MRQELIVLKTRALFQAKVQGGPISRERFLPGTIRARVNFAQELVREEQRRDFHQASYESLQPDQPRDKLLPEENSAEVERRRLSPSFQESLGLYPRPEQSSTAPFQRFATLGGTNDPNSLLAKQALGNMGIQPGDMQTAQMRGALAEEVTKEAQGMKRTSSLTTGPLTGHRGKRRRNRRSSVDDQTSEHESESSEE
ncbi:MAG: hypothetical protein M1821_004719 [Bathelium mastoideum]|nr:MAG: hypothetical protein M1821_004719 [Bathelium mastoideum]